MRVSLNTGHPSKPLFWFTSDQKIYLNFEKPTVNIESPSQLPIETIRQLVNGHKRKLITVSNITFLEQLLREALEGKRKQQAAPPKPSAKREIRRNMPIKKLKETEDEQDEAYKTSQLSIAKLKTVLEQITNPDLLARIYKYELKRQNPRKSAKDAILKRGEELGVSLMAIVEDTEVDLVIEETEEGQIAIDPENKKIWAVDENGNPIESTEDNDKIKDE